MFLHRKVETISNYDDVAAGGAITGYNRIKETKEKNPSSEEGEYL